jgi:hypothetical protein
VNNQFCVAGGALFFGEDRVVKRCINLITYHNAMAKVSWYHNGHCHLTMMILKLYSIFMMLSCWHDSNVHSIVMTLSFFRIFVTTWWRLAWKNEEVVWCHGDSVGSYHDEMMVLSWWHVESIKNGTIPVH